MKKYLTLALAGLGALTLSSTIKERIRDYKLDRDMKATFPSDPQ